MLWPQKVTTLLSSPPFLAGGRNQVKNNIYTGGGFSQKQNTASSHPPIMGTLKKKQGSTPPRTPWGLKSIRGEKKIQIIALILHLAV